MSVLILDIRKLLEDYVAYLSSRPDFQSENKLLPTKSRTSRNTPESFTLIPSSSTRSNKFTKWTKVDSPLVNPKINHIVVQTGPANEIIAPVLTSSEVSPTGTSRNYYIEIPTESGVTMNLSDEELSTFIDNVIGIASGTDQSTTVTDFETTKSSIIDYQDQTEATTFSPIIEIPVANLNSTNGTQMGINVSIDTIQPSKRNSNGSDAKMEKLDNRNNKIINSSSGGNTIRNGEALPTAIPLVDTTESSFTRLEIFENSQEKGNSIDPNFINLVSKETANGVDTEKDSPVFPYYTYKTDSTSEHELGNFSKTGDPISTTVSTLSLDEGTNSGDMITTESTTTNTKQQENNQTLSSNVDLKFTNFDDSELMRELKRTKDLLRIQIEKLQMLENSDQMISIRNSLLRKLTNLTASSNTATLPTTTTNPVINNDDDGEITTTLPSIITTTIIPTETTTTTMKGSNNANEMMMMMRSHVYIGEKANLTINETIEWDTEIDFDSTTTTMANFKDEDNENEEIIDSPTTIDNERELITTSENTSKQSTNIETLLESVLTTTSAPIHETTTTIKMVKFPRSELSESSAETTNDLPVDVIEEEIGENKSGKTDESHGTNKNENDEKNGKASSLLNQTSKSYLESNTTNNINYDNKILFENVELNHVNESDEAENSTTSIYSITTKSDPPKPESLTGPMISNHHYTISNDTSSVNRNDQNETDNDETMILTHVPKITIIHKIMKQNDGTNSNRTILSEEDAYREALQKHKDLIKSAMSSVSLYPAAFKRYQIDEKNNVNIGEIYLLPNFDSASGAGGESGGLVIAESAASILDPDSGNLLNGSQHMVSIDRPTQKHEHQRFNQNLSTITPTNTFESALKHENAIQIRSSGSKKLTKFAYKQNENKFNLDHHDDGTKRLNKNNNHQHQKQNHYQHQHHHHHHHHHDLDVNLRERANLYAQYMKTLIVANQNDFQQKPESMLRIFRPRYVHQKRFKKVRIPIGQRYRKKKKPSIDERDNGRESRPISAYLTSSPILISAAQSSDGSVSRITRTQKSKEKIIAKKNKKKMEIDAIRTDGTQTSRVESPSPLPSQFKVFCTFDAHRSLSTTINGNVTTIPNVGDADSEVVDDHVDSNGLYFDINQLEHNSPILSQCTHLVYAFANLNMNGEVLPGNVATHDETLNGESERINRDALIRIRKIKDRFPHLKLLAAIGGWNTPPQLFALLVATGKLRDRLSQNVHKFVLNYDFDGAIISWFYPLFKSKQNANNSSQRSIRSSAGQSLFHLDDKQNLVRFVRALRTRFASIPNRPLQIGIMAPPFDELIDRGFDVPKLTKYVNKIL